jgi:hypothetical protein
MPSLPPSQYPVLSLKDFLYLFEGAVLQHGNGLPPSAPPNAASLPLLWTL